MVCRLIALDKKLGLRLGEVLWRIAGKAVMKLCKNDITHAAGALQLSAAQDAGVQAIYTLCMIFFLKKIQKPFY